LPGIPHIPKNLISFNYTGKSARKQEYLKKNGINSQAQRPHPAAAAKSALAEVARNLKCL
jgi:hypothetical protein